MQDEKDKELKEPSMEEIFEEFPAGDSDDEDEEFYDDEDEEEEADTMFPLADFEEQFYDDEGNFIEDEE